MKAHWVPPLLCVRPFGGVSLPGFFPGLFPAAQSLWGGVLRLLWLMLTSAPSRQPLQRRAFLAKRKVEQISPDKNVNCRYTTAAFTISPESVDFVMWC